MGLEVVHLIDAEALNEETEFVKAGRPVDTFWDKLAVLRQPRYRCLCTSASSCPECSFSVDFYQSSTLGSVLLGVLLETPPVYHEVELTWLLPLICTEI